MMRILFKESEISARVAELGAEITEAYKGKELTVVALLNGGMIFASDLIRRIALPARLDTLALSSYAGDRQTGNVKIRSELKYPVGGRHILLADDILDTGVSLARALEYLRALHPADIATCVFLDKKTGCPKPVPRPDWVGREVENVYVVGYGLDSRELYRNLPYIGVIEGDGIGRDVFQ